MLLMDGKELTKAISTAALGTAKGRMARGRPILECVKIDAAEGYLTAIGYDLETQVTARMPAGTNGTGLHAVLAAKPLLQVLKSAKGTVGLEAEGLTVTITAGSARHQLEGFNPNEFPETPKISAEWESAPGKSLSCY